MPEPWTCPCGYVAAGEAAETVPETCPVCGRPVATVEPEAIPEDNFDAATQDTHSAAPLWLRLILDPRTIQRLLFGGGGLSILGLLAWLISLGVFDDPRIVAVAMGLGNAAILLTGFAVTLRTRHQLAGRAMTFLACVLAPLNLWFYDAQGLMTVDGHLWVASVVCCLIYLLTISLLKDPLYLFAIEAGVTLTVLLCLGTWQRHTDSVWICTALTILAALSIHLERAFPPEHTLYNRRRFGLPIFFSGQAQLVAAMGGLLGLQLAHWFQVPFVRVLWTESAIATTPIIAGSLWLAAAYLWLYSDFVVRRLGLYSELAVLAIVMAEITWLEQRLTNNGVMVTMAVTVLAVRWFMRNKAQPSRVWQPFSQIAGCLLALVPVALAVQQYLSLSATTVTASLAIMNVTATAAVMLATCGSAGLMKGIGRTLLISAAACTGWIVGVQVCELIGLLGLLISAPVLCAVPLILAIIAQRQQASGLWEGMITGAHAWVISGLVLSLATHDPAGHPSNLLFTAPQTWQAWLAALALIELTVFSALCARQQKTVSEILWGITGLWGLLATWKVVSLINLENVWYAPVLAAIGVALSLVGHWQSHRTSQQPELPVNSWSNLGDLILVIAELSAFLRGAFRLAGAVSLTGHAPLVAIILTTLLAAIGSQAAWSSAARRWHIVATVLLTLMSVAAAMRFLSLADYQKWELAAAILGAWLIILGYIGRLQEASKVRDAGVSAALWCGSIVATLPVLCFVLGDRWFSGHSIQFDEVLLVTISLMLLASGCLLQVRSTTLLGGFGLALYLITLFAHLAYQPQIAIGVYLAIGGGLIFLAGLMLSIYRDRFLALPGKIAQREGVFQIIDWR
ncbi:hypothetical protein GC163_03475 [bacterium]|nr:hypothetical protein [bacterium]